EPLVTDVWVPVSALRVTEPQTDFANRESPSFLTLGRLRPGGTAARATLAPRWGRRRRAPRAGVSGPPAPAAARRRGRYVLHARARPETRDRGRPGGRRPRPVDCLRQRRQSHAGARDLAAERDRRPARHGCVAIADRAAAGRRSAAP